MSDNENIIDTFTELAPRYEKVVDNELNRFWGWSYEDFVNKLLRMTTTKENDVVLDIATGTGVIPSKIIKSHNQNLCVHGLDITLSMLHHAQKKFIETGLSQEIKLVCATAMEMPYSRNSFNIALCGLATHHMDVKILLSEILRVLKPGGSLSIADVGGSRLWNFPGIKTVLKLFAFLYYVFQENFQRAWAEASAVSNIRTKEEWFETLDQLGFNNIKIIKIESKFFWIPDPLVITANKTEE